MGALTFCKIPKVIERWENGLGAELFTDLEYIS
jgi:hypothetical protein